MAPVGERKNGRRKRTHEKQADEESMKVGLSKEDALYQSKWIAGINLIITRLK